MAPNRRKLYGIEEGLRRTTEVNKRIIGNLYLGGQDDVPLRPKGFIAQTQCHANVLNLPQAKSGKSKVFWTIVICLAVTGLIIELFHVMTRYIKSPKASEIKIHSVAQMKFPAVVICNLNPLNRSYLTTKNVSMELALYSQKIYATMKNDAGGSKDEEKGLTLDKQLHQLMHAYPNNDLRTFFHDAGHSCHEFFQACAFQWRSFDCCSIIGDIFDVQFGKCFLLESGSFNQSYPAAGLQLKVHIPKKTVAPSFGPPSRGIALRIMDDYDPSATEYAFMGLGKHAAIQMEQIQHHYLNTFMKTVCRESSVQQPEFADISDANYTYNQCIGLCFNKAAIRICNCTYPQDTRVFGTKGSLRICTPLEAKQCLVSRVETDPPTLSCAADCLPECSQTQYRISISTADLYGDTEKDDALDSIAILDIYFAKIQTTLIQEIYIVTADGLISQIGGLLGIFLGASLITAVQLIIYTIELLHGHMRNCMEKFSEKRDSTETPRKSSTSPAASQPVASSPSNQLLVPPVCNTVTHNGSLTVSEC